MSEPDACAETVVHLQCGGLLVSHTMQPVGQGRDGLGVVYVCGGCQLRVLVIPADPEEAS